MRGSLRFGVCWRALRSHDDRFEVEINQIDLNNTPPPRIIFSGDGFNGHDLTDDPELLFPALDLPPGAIYAKIVEKCGDRKYWETWAQGCCGHICPFVYSNKWAARGS